MLTLDKIYQASHVLRSVIRKTDLIQAPKLCPDCNLFLKTENLQVTGSFKVRGAYYMMSQLTEEELTEQGIKPNTIRLSIGIENIDDLLAALDKAFEAVK